MCSASVPERSGWPSSDAKSTPLIPCLMARGCFTVRRSRLRAPPRSSLACGTEITDPQYHILSNERSCFQAHSLVGQYETRLYHEERPHQGLGNEMIAPKTTSVGPGPVQCRERLGGALKFYYRAAA